MDMNPLLSSMLQIRFQLDVLFTLFLVQNYKVKLISIHVKLYNHRAKTPAEVWKPVPPGNTYLFPTPVSLRGLKQASKAACKVNEIAEEHP